MTPRLLGGKLIFHIFGALAEFERNLIKERTTAGLIAARARGRKGGRPKALTAKQRSIAQELYEKHHPIAEICRALNISRATLYRLSRLRKDPNNSESGYQLQAIPPRVNSHFGKILKKEVSMRSWDALPNVPLRVAGPVTAEFMARGITSFQAAGRYLQALPYGRTANRTDFSAVLHEGRGTCSTKHALLATLAHEQQLPVALTLGIYEMSEENTPGVGVVLAHYGLASLRRRTAI